MKSKFDYIIEKIKHIQKIQILELGVRKGDSTRKFIELCNANDGFLTSVDIDDCSSSPCRNDGTCIDKINRYICNCKSGYNGTVCETGNYFM